MASLSVTNTTGDDVIIIGPKELVLEGSQWKDESPQITSISAMPQQRIVAARSTYRTYIPLPRCQTSCRRTVIVSFAFSRHSNGTLTLSWPALNYMVAQDPRVAFYGSGGVNYTTDGPLLVTFGGAQDTLFPDWNVSVFTATSAADRLDPSRLAGDINRRLEAALPANGSIVTPFEEGVLVAFHAADREPVERAIGVLKRDFADRGSITQTYYSVGTFESLDALAAAKARALATQLAELAGTGLSPAASYSDTYSYGYVLYGDDLQSDALTKGTRETLWAATVLRATEPYKAMPVRLALQQHAYAAAQAAQAFSTDAEERSYALGASRTTGELAEAPFQPAVSLVPHVPQLFVSGFGIDASARRYGIAPAAAALYDADRRAAMVARVLGVRLGSVNLLASYPQDTSGVHGAAIARTIEGERFASIPNPTAPSVATADTAEIKTPVSLSGDSYDSVTARASLDVPAQMMVLDVNIDRGDVGDFYSSLYSAPAPVRAPAAIAKDLARQPWLARVLTTPSESARSSYQYELLLRTTGISDIRSALAFFNAEYANARPSVTSVARPIAAHCDAHEQVLVAASARSALGRARARWGARSSKPIFVVVAPLIAHQGACGIPARPLSREELIFARPIDDAPTTVTLGLSLQLSYLKGT